MSEKTPQSYLAENPRMIGVLFMILILLGEVGAVSAGGVAIYGP
ncbi:DUF7503 family protein [Haladaptatus pallidirubidus]